MNSEYIKFDHFVVYAYAAVNIDQNSNIQFHTQIIHRTGIFIFSFYIYIVDVAYLKALSLLFPPPPSPPSPPSLPSYQITEY